MSLRLAVLGAGAVDGSVLDLTGDYGREVVAFADPLSSVVDSDGLNPSTVHDRRERKGVVDGADPEAVFDADYGMLMEATPTTLDDAGLSLSHVERALTDDRHVVLANKDPVTERYTDLRAFKAGSGGTVQLEAAVGDATPILSTISGLGALYVTAARGMLSGTANSILSRMAAKGLDYEYILTEAQDLGVVKVDLTFDVDGINAALEFVTFTNVLSDGGMEYALGGAAVEGIRSVPGAALSLIAEDGQTVKLVSEATADEVRVAPRLIPQDSAPSVMGTQNIIQLETKRTGQLNINGRGAGGPETATAILFDVSQLE